MYQGAYSGPYVGGGMDVKAEDQQRMKANQDKLLEQLESQLNRGESAYPGQSRGDEIGSSFEPSRLESNLESGRGRGRGRPRGRGRGSRGPASGEANAHVASMGMAVPTQRRGRGRAAADRGGFATNFSRAPPSFE